LLFVASGCSLFHHGESPQQQYAEALKRGNAMQASQVWLNMSPEDRMKFGRGEGIKPDESSKSDVQQMMMKHEDETGHGPSNAEEIEEQMPTPLGASIRDLPGATESSPAPSN
jgi:redox-sensitive bicupin YhaK (pirin superfamily)